MLVEKEIAFNQNAGGLSSAKKPPPEIWLGHEGFKGKKGSHLSYSLITAGEGHHHPLLCVGLWTPLDCPIDAVNFLKNAQHKSCEISFIWGSMRTAAQETARQIALRNCSKEAVREGQYVHDFGKDGVHAIKHV